ncbi:hypothetical protein QJS10_CPA09g01047 [Acorus calamus]|uniref:Uncharacterized protein n=1 Tax=Acorus calamus TaxID=4465 RepID=A0AAV9E952_ACOCL|nr:hypothetical protein QJS10_CPA09g01047 [Acorus calamus]
MNPNLGQNVRKGRRFTNNLIKGYEKPESLHNPANSLLRSPHERNSFDQDLQIFSIIYRSSRGEGTCLKPKFSLPTLQRTLHNNQLPGCRRREPKHHLVFSQPPNSIESYTLPCSFHQPRQHLNTWTWTPHPRHKNTKVKVIHPRLRLQGPHQGNNNRPGLKRRDTRSRLLHSHLTTTMFYRQRPQIRTSRSAMAIPPARPTFWGIATFPCLMTRP